MLPSALQITFSFLLYLPESFFFFSPSWNFSLPFSFPHLPPPSGSWMNFALPSPSPAPHAAAVGEGRAGRGPPHCSPGASACPGSGKLSGAAEHGVTSQRARTPRGLAEGSGYSRAALGPPSSPSHGRVMLRSPKHAATPPARRAARLSGVPFKHFSWWEGYQGANASAVASHGDSFPVLAGPLPSSRDQLTAVAAVACCVSF